MACAIASRARSSRRACRDRGRRGLDRPRAARARGRRARGGRDRDGAPGGGVAPRRAPGRRTLRPLPGAGPPADRGGGRPLPGADRAPGAPRAAPVPARLGGLPRSAPGRHPRRTGAAPGDGRPRGVGAGGAGGPPGSGGRRPRHRQRRHRLRARLGAAQCGGAGRRGGGGRPRRRVSKRPRARALGAGAAARGRSLRAPRLAVGEPRPGGGQPAIPAERGDRVAAARGVAPRAARRAGRRAGRPRRDPPHRGGSAPGAEAGRVAADGDRRGAGGPARLAHGRRGILRHPGPAGSQRRGAVHRRALGGHADHTCDLRLRRGAPGGLLMATRLIVEGGAPLRGEVAASAAKNAALPALCAALLTARPVVLENVPALADVTTTRSLLERLGGVVSTDADGSTRVVVEKVTSNEAPYELVSTMRASVLVLGPLLARTGLAKVALPGGCAIGVRPIDQHLKGFQKLGAEVFIRNGYVEARASRLKGARISTDLVTVTGTENLMMAAALAEGTTVIENAAREPEVTDLARLLTAMGARIHGAGTDRIEAGTLLVAAAITGGDVTVTGTEPRHMSAMLAKLEESGSAVTVTDDRIRCQGPARPKAVDLITNPFPGFATDMQAQFMAMLGLADGISKITETIFENRFMHAAELARLGAKIEAEGSTAVVRGQRYYQGAPVMATDLRASASLVLAGLAARGRTEISRVYHLDRGYEGLEKKLQSLGARIERLR